MQGVRKRFGATVALDGVDLAVDPGEILALVGENGAGKSTLMKVLSGAHSPDAGEMWLDGVPYAPRDPLEARRRGVAMIYQELSLARDLTVMENILLGMEPARGPFLRWSEMRRRAADAMAQLGRPDIDPDRPLNKLSIAEQQLVEIGTRHLHRLPRAGSRRADQQPDAIRYPASVRSHQAAQGTRPGDHLHLAFSGRGARDFRSFHGSSRRPKRRRRSDGADTPTSQIISMMVGRSVDDLYPRSPRKAGRAGSGSQASRGRIQAASTRTFHCIAGKSSGLPASSAPDAPSCFVRFSDWTESRAGKCASAAYVGPASPGAAMGRGSGTAQRRSKKRRTGGRSEHRRQPHDDAAGPVW